MEKITKALEISVIAGVPCTLTPEQCTELIARIAELEEERRWIPVDERLPDDSTMVLFTDGVTKGIGKFSEDGFYDYWYDGFFNKPVTHWMPLPESPNDTQTDTVVYGKEREE